MTAGARPPSARLVTPWAAYLRKLAADRGWTIKQLAGKTGISRATMNRWLSGEIQMPPIEKVKKIAEAAGVDPMEALRAAGHLDIGGASENWEVQMIRESGLPARVVDQLVRDTLERQQRERDSRRAQLEQQIELLRSTALNTI